jgi:hypothetical protein
MPNNTPTDPKLENFLYAYTDALLDGSANTAILAHQHGVSIMDAHSYTVILDRMDGALVVSAPSTQFKRDLRTQLLGEPTPSLMGRFRNLPPRLQFAAGIALLAAMALLGRRRFRAEFSALLQQLHENQPHHEAQASEAKISAG